MFGRVYHMTLNRVHDVVRIHEGRESLTLYVEMDSMRLVAGISNVQPALKSISEDTPEEETLRIANAFAAAIFGAEQAEKLADFYRNDPGCIIGICSRYFSGRLNKLIERAQKKIRK